MATVVVAGSVAQRPGRGGHAWVFLNYLLGLRGLGHEVHFVDWLTPEMVGSPNGDLARSAEAQWLDRVMRSFGLGADYTLIVDDGGSGGESSRRPALERLGGADLLLNVNGFIRDPELLEAAAVTAFLDIDPAIQQMWVALGLADLFSGHDLHFTVGANIGRGECEVPTCGVEWIPTRPPVFLPEWPVTAPGREFTTVASWRGPYGTIEYEGESYGLRVHEFRRLAGLAEAVDAELAVALAIDAEDAADAEALQEAGWKLRDPLVAAGTAEAYRAFVAESYAEISVAKNVYVRSRCGWFSDRSAAYLASGRPVLAQETGYSDDLPTGLGLIPFADAEGAVEGIEAVRSDWAAHSAAARQLAEEYFGSDVVLEGMLAAAGIGPALGVGAGGQSAEPAEPVRLNWGCGNHVREGWVNSDIKEAPEVDLVADILEGFPFEADTVEYAVSVHALPELAYDDQVPALTELRRVLRPGGVLRLVLPDLRRAIDAYLAGDKGYFGLVEDDASTPGGRFVTQMLWYGYSRTLFTTDFAAELLQKAGFVDIVLCDPGRTESRFPEIVELDNRESESFYIEATKSWSPGTAQEQGYNRPPAMAVTSEVQAVSLEKIDGGGDLKAAHLDGPVAGMRFEQGPLRVVGWVVGEREPVREVEVVSEHKVVGRAPVNVPRPGVAERFAEVEGADAAGFDLRLEPSGKGVSELQVAAVHADGSRSALATIRVDVTRRGLFSRLFG